MNHFFFFLGTACRCLSLPSQLNADSTSFDFFFRLPSPLISFAISFTSFLTHVENQIIRSYTPVPKKYASSSNISDDSVSVVDLLFIIKTYENGAFSSFLKASEEVVNLSLKPKGALNLYCIRNFTKFSMLAAGSGITPMYSVLEHLLERRENRV